MSDYKEYYRKNRTSILRRSKYRVKHHSEERRAYFKRYRRQYFKRNRTHILRRQKRWIKRNYTRLAPLKKRYEKIYTLGRKYSLTLEQYEVMHRWQKGKCAICGIPEKKLMETLNRRLSVDHNHQTGKVRGLLCSLCNLALGHFEKRGVGVIRKIAEYAKRPDIKIALAQQGV